MKTLLRRQRRMREREDLFLNRSRRLFLQWGYHGLTMKRIAAATGYSRAAIYQVFNCKEDIIISLVSRCMEQRLAMIERAATFSGKPRERMQAVGEAVELFARLHPEECRILYNGSTDAVVQKASEKSLNRTRTVSHRTMSIVSGIVRDAMAQGDLALPAGVTPVDVVFNLWAITDGGHTVALSWIPPTELGVADAFDAVMRGCHVLCDGYGWKPLSTEWDYERTRWRIRREMFAEESRAVWGAELVDATGIWQPSRRPLPEMGARVPDEEVMLEHSEAGQR